MALFGFLNQWWNVPYLVLLGLVLVFMALQFLGILGDAVDADADVDVDADADVDVDADSDADADGDGDWQGALAFLGVGRVPLMVVWPTLFFSTGLTGLCVNSVLYEWFNGEFAPWHLALSSVAAVVVGVCCTALVSRVAARFVDTGGKGATTLAQLCGSMGTVASPHLTSEDGEIRVRARVGGEEVLVHGKLAQGEAPLRHGDTVVLVDFDAEKCLYQVSSLPEGALVRRN